MSHENVEVVRRILPPPDMDLTELFMRDAHDEDPGLAAALEVAGEAFTPDFVCVFHALSDEPRRGVRGLREGWRDWLEPWESYRAVVDELRDLGQRVAVFSRDFGRRSGMADEVEFKGVSVYTIRDRKIARAEYFTDRSQAIERLGLAE